MLSRDALHPTAFRSLIAGDMFPLIGLAFAKLLLHLSTNGRYGYFRDEFYYIACGEHLDFGYVDHPPLVAFMAWLSRAFLGDSLSALRFSPALAGAFVVLFAGLIARELGGGRFARILAALAAIIAPVYLVGDTIFSMNAFDQLFWVLAVFVLLHIVRGGDPRLWILFGIIAGIGLQNKHSLLFLGFGLTAGLLLTPARAQFRTKWPWLAALTSFLIFLPNIVWEARYGWPTLEFASRAALTKNVALSPMGFLAGQMGDMHPVSFPLLLAGMIFLLFSSRGKPFRAFGWAYLSILILFIASHGKTYYIAPLYPLLFAAGAVWWESYLRRKGWRRARPATIAVVLAAGAVTAPLALPILPIEGFISYADTLGIRFQKMERHETGVLPQHFADMFGWENMVATIAEVYRSLPPDDRSKCGIFVQNYGEAGAIDFLGRKYGLPKAMSGHNNYWLWGTGGKTGEVLVVVGGREQDLAALFREHYRAAVIFHPYSMPYENNLPVYVCRGIGKPLYEVWAMVRNFN